MNNFSKIVVYWLKKNPDWWALTQSKIGFVVRPENLSPGDAIQVGRMCQVWLESAAEENVEFLEEKGTRLDKIIKGWVGLALCRVEWDLVGKDILEEYYDRQE